MMSDFFKKHKQPLLLYGGSLLYFILLVILATATQDGYPYNNLAIDTDLTIGSFEIRVAWYAVFILSGIIIAATISYFEFKRYKVDPDILFDGLLYAVPIAIIGARVWYVMFNSDTSLFDIQGGGLAIHGAVIFVFIFLIFFTKWKKVSYWWMLDVVAPGFLIGQAMGRWGNFMNAELYGPVVDKLNFVPAFIREQMFIGGEYHHPTFLYESLWNFVGLIILLVLRRKRIFKIGDMVAFYLIWYGIIRIPMELLRFNGNPSDPLPLPWLNVASAWYEMTSLWISVIIILVGVGIIVGKRILRKDLPYYNEFKSEDV